MTYLSSKDSDQTCNPSSLTRVFASCTNNACYFISSNKRRTVTCMEYDFSRNFHTSIFDFHCRKLHDPWVCTIITMWVRPSVCSWSVSENAHNS